MLLVGFSKGQVVAMSTHADEVAEEVRGWEERRTEGWSVAKASAASNISLPRFGPRHRSLLPVRSSQLFSKDVHGSSLFGMAYSSVLKRGATAGDGGIKIIDLSNGFEELKGEAINMDTR